ncbi:hypothetical protein KEM55_003162, partial [Ascosphaera atra]
LLRGSLHHLIFPHTRFYQELPFKDISPTSGGDDHEQGLETSTAQQQGQESSNVQHTEDECEAQGQNSSAHGYPPELQQSGECSKIDKGVVTEESPNEESGVSQEVNNEQRRVQEERVQQEGEHEEQHQEQDRHDKEPDDDSVLNEADVETLLREQHQQFAKELGQAQQEQQRLHEQEFEDF